MAFTQTNRALSPILRRRKVTEARARLIRSTGQLLVEQLQPRLLLAEIGTGTGLSATYFDNPDLTGASMSQVDATVNFDWERGSPATGITPNTYSARWTGQVEPLYSENYTFYTTSDDGVRLWVNGDLLVDDWNRHAATVNSGQITLQAGEKYDIRMEYFQNYGTAVADLEWSSASQARQIIPTSQLYVGNPAPAVGTGTGLAARYFDNPDFTGASISRVDPKVNFSWQSDSPAAGIEPYTYSIRWTGKVQPRYSETYTFQTTGNDGVRLWVNGDLLVDDWNNHPATIKSGQIALQAGEKYDIRMEYYQNHGTAVAKLKWSSPSQARQIIPTSQLYSDESSPAAGAGTGLSATYFDNPDLTGASALRVDPTVDFDWQGTSPAAGIEPDTYSARWTGQVEPLYSETYTFHTTSDDGVRLWVNGDLLVDDWTSHSATVNSGQITLQAGQKYDIRMEYYQNYGSASAKLEWSSPTEARQVVPSSQLYPADPAPPTGPIDPPPADPGITPPPLPGTWQMIFQDEFSGSALNPVWHTAQYWDHSVTVVGQGELQAYHASAVSVESGMLHLTARRDNQYGVPYVSGLVQTGGDDTVTGEPKFSFRYGYMEVRAKLAGGQGLWPAIWMMPASYNDGNGELDVVEVLGGDPTRANFNLHRQGQHEGEEWVGPDFTEGFHTFGVDWQPDHVTFYVDGVERARMTDPALICPEAMYPILNVAVGGDWGGPPDATTVFPVSMDVDYVRVWQT